MNDAMFGKCRWWFHVHIGRVIPLRWNHRIVLDDEWPTCECGWKMKSADSRNRDE